MEEISSQEVNLTLTGTQFQLQLSPVLYTETSAICQECGGDQAVGNI